MKTAIIDNGIDLETLSLYSNEPINLKVCDNKVVSGMPPSDITHGGLCARVFASQTGVLPDVSICLTRDDTHRSNIIDLTLALEWCLNNNIDLISLSMGTTRICDNAMLYSIIEKLHQAGVILVAAANNKGLVTYPAALDTCIGVCQTDIAGLESGRYAYIQHPFDGIDIVTHPVDFFNYHIHGTNSLSAAYIAGIIKSEISNATSAKCIRRWLSETAQRMPNDWERAYFMQKMGTEEHEAIIIACCFMETMRGERFMEELQKHIERDGYTCAVLMKRGEYKFIDHRFVIKPDFMSLGDLFALVARLYCPNIILVDAWELANISDVLVYDKKKYNSLISSVTYSYEINNISPDCLWLKVRELFER